MKDSLSPFNLKIQNSYQHLIKSWEGKIPEEERLRIDLHCHDANSNVTDELWGRILRVPETWVETKQLVNSLKTTGCQAITITNHNNARSCWQLLDKGEDVLVGAEFSCCLPKEDLKLHVLAYGFSPDDENRLNKLRKDLYQFLAYTAERDIPTVLAHPLYFYSNKRTPDIGLFEKLSLLFERFEVANGQRDIWQNLLVWQWLNDLTEEKIDGWSDKYQINPYDFSKNPYQKRVTGGSDDHMAIFAGTCGSYLHIPNLHHRLKTEKPSLLALEGIKKGKIAPFGYVGNEEKLNVSLLDYVSQMTLHMKDPGLLRMALHNGSMKDKLYCLGALNAIQELKRHKFTVNFFKTFHEALSGKRPGILLRRRVSADFRPIVKQIDQIAKSRFQDHKVYLRTLEQSIPDMFEQMMTVIVSRIRTNEDMTDMLNFEGLPDIQDLLQRFEIPSHFRGLFNSDTEGASDKVSQGWVSRFFDQISFPILTAGMIAGTSLLSARSLTANRPFLNEFAECVGQYQHPERVLWLTDTLKDKNGVSTSLSAKLTYIKETNLPIDFLICDNTIPEEPHLKVVKSMTQFTFPNYEDQAIDIPNLLDIKKIFVQGRYDRIVCSTEMSMGLVALYLKSSFSIPTYFFLHTDWLEFLKNTTHFNTASMDRIRRILRFFYRSFSGVFVLNKDDRDWLTGREIRISKKKVFLTSHWVSETYYPRENQKTAISLKGVKKDDFVILYAGRVSAEKGVLELPVILDRVKSKRPNTKLVIAGVGPELETLKKHAPEAIFLGWVEKERMPDLYSSASLLALPSRFDTFGNVVLEAMSCGLPVASYRAKGPEEIIDNSNNGILADDLDEMALDIARLACDTNRLNMFKKRAINRAGDFRREDIMDRFLTYIGIEGGRNQRGLKNGNPPFLDDCDPYETDLKTAV